MRAASQKKGIFCIEGNWDSDLRRQSTVRPVLELLRLNEDIPYIYREAATISEFEFYAAKWTLRKYSAYPILYLPTHGTEEGILLDDGEYSLHKLSELLDSRCKGRIVIVASCSSMNVNLRVLRKFLDVTEALAVCGYRSEVDWMRSTAFELLLLSTMQENEFSGRGIDAINRKLEEHKRSFRDIDFRLVSAKQAS